MSSSNTMQNALKDGALCPRCAQPMEAGAECPLCAQPVVDPHIGLTLGGRYRIDEVIGSGGIGNVYRGRHLDLGEDVAVKFLRGVWSESPALRARFRREAVAMARLRHPCIVSLIDFGEHDGELYMVMELVRGGPLSELFSKGPLSPRRVGAIFVEILQVLEAAHSVGIFHRDMKPANVMLLDSGDHVERVKVLDFGLAYVADAGSDRRLTETGTAQGTPMYMSPEQCRGHDVGAATDIYAVGVMLFEALTGVGPFAGEEAALLMAQHMFMEAPRMSSVGSEIPFSEGLEALVHRALAKDPAQRPTAAEMRTMLVAALDRTDEATDRDRATNARVAMMGLSRGERALVDSRFPRITPSTPLSGQVVLWMLEDPSAQELRMTLEVNQLTTTVSSSSDPPPRGAALIVVLAEPDGGARTRLVRTLPGLERVPVLVLDAATTSRVSELIRAGANDVVLSADGRGEVLSRVKRLLRRGR